MTTYYVSQSATNGFAVGVDTNNGTSMSTPFLTYDKLNSVILDNDFSIGNDGTYQASAANNYHRFNRNATHSAFNPGAVVLQPYPGYTSQCVNSAPGSVGTATFNGIIFDGAGTAQYVMNFGNTANTWVFNDCRAINGTSGGWRLTSSTGHFWFKRSKAIGAMNESGIRADSFGNGGSLHIDDFELGLTNVTTTGAGVYVVGNAAGVSARIHNVYGKITVNGTSTARGIRADNVSNLVISGLGIGDNLPTLTLDGNTTGNTSLISARNTGSIATSRPVIDGFRGRNLTDKGYLIDVGNDGVTGAASDYMISDPQCDNCDLEGDYKSTTKHGILFGTCNGGSISNNRIRGVQYGIVSKLNNGKTYVKKNRTSQIRTGGFHIVSKGSQGNIISGNQCYSTVGFNAGFVESYNDSGASLRADTGGISIGNNFFGEASLSGNYVMRVGTPGDAGDTSAMSFYGNNYWLPAGSGANTFAVGSATTYSTLAAWIAAQDIYATNNQPAQMHADFFRTSYAPIVAAELSRRIPWSRQAMGV